MAFAYSENGRVKLAKAHVHVAGAVLSYSMAG
jgi:hypothetical protein